jgi:hypothetical protein
MSTWRRFRALNARDRALVAEAAGLLLLIRVALSIFPFSTVRRGLLALTRVERRSSAESLKRLAWAVTASASHLPIETTCLVRALTCEAMSHRRGWRCDLRFGVQPLPATANVLSAHSWVEYDGAVILGDVDNLAAYKVLTREHSQ